jgi:mannose-1-phosphate guanylyltransferase
MASIHQAFVLGAGLGTRLRPLTEDLPKPLVPIFQKPLITFAFDHLIDSGCEKFCVNTHHCPERFGELFTDSQYRSKPLTFRHEPVLLETAGGIANVADLLGDEPFLVYNADILSDLPLAPLLEEHERSGNIVTLVLRSGAGPRHIAFDPGRRRIVDIRNLVGTGAPDEFVFTGIYAVEPEFLGWIEKGVKRSVIPAFLEMIRRDAKLGGVVIDDGYWWDVGTRAAYMQLHRELPSLAFPRYGVLDAQWCERVHASAQLGAGAQLHGASIVAAHARIGAHAVLRDTIVWQDGEVASGAQLTNCIVRSARRAAGVVSDADF